MEKVKLRTKAGQLIGGEFLHSRERLDKFQQELGRASRRRARTGTRQGSGEKIARETRWQQGSFTVDDSLAMVICGMQVPSVCGPGFAVARSAPSPPFR
jgi:hypothetical protein